MAKLTKAEWVDFVPTLRDRIIGKAQDGLWHKDKAERVAEKLKVGPLATHPDPSRFDPMTEPVWTLAMVIAWIVWRTPDDVRENWDDYRKDCWQWQWHPRMVSRDGGREWQVEGGWWELKTRDRASLIRLLGNEALSDRADQDEARKLVTVRQARKELWQRACEGGLSVWAIRDDNGHPTRIEAGEWAYLKHTGDNGLGDELRFDPVARRQYRDMTFQRDEVCGLWPPVTASNQTIAGENNCQQWLEGEMRRSPNRRPKPKGEYKTEAQRRFNVSERAFERAWDRAIAATGAMAWSQAGRPSKNHRTKITAPK